MTKEHLKNYEGEDKIVDSHEFYDEISQLPPVPMMKFGLNKLDAITGGFCAGHLITISGYTGFGKTTFCQTVSYNIAQEDIKSLWFSYELSPRQFFNKYKNRNVPLFYMPKKNKPYNLEWIDDRIAECKLKHGLKVVFIDHLHYVVPMLVSDNKKTDLIGDAVRAIKQMSVDHDIAIFLMAHTRQPKSNIAPTIGDIRDSSFVAQESDIVLVMHRPVRRGGDEYEPFGTVNVLKLREGGRGGKVKLEVYNDMFYEQIDRESEKAL